MDQLLKGKLQYETLVNNASKVFSMGRYGEAIDLYHNALNLGNQIGIGKMASCVLKYMICQCQYESNQLHLLAEAATVLETLDTSLKERFPATYVLLAKIHCKLYRFDQAQSVINKCESILNKHKGLETFYIPSTKIEIKPHTKDVVFSEVKTECLTRHTADAVCNHEACNNITIPYKTPNKNIFFKDPAFSGAVFVTCNKRKNPCSLAFHPSCWKSKKNGLYPYGASSDDKEILGNPCLTSNCSDKAPCIISKIDIIDRTGKMQSYVKEMTTLSFNTHKNTSKGAIKKENTQMKRENINIKPKKSQTNKKTDRYDFDGDQRVRVIGEITDVNFSGDPDEDQKNFLFSLFYSYIKNNDVKVKDVYAKFKEYNEETSLKDLDILVFLLNTESVKVLDKETSLLPHISEHALTPKSKKKSVNHDCTQDLEDIYDDFMKDDENCTENEIQATEIQRNENSMIRDNTYKNSMTPKFNYGAAGGDASSYTRTVVENENKLQYIKLLKDDRAFIMEQKQSLELKLQNMNRQIELVNSEKKECDEKIMKMNNVLNEFQKKYENMREDNKKLKKEIDNLIREKSIVEKQLSECSDPIFAKKELLKNFQDEFKILQDCISADWEEKVKNLEQLLESEKNIKMTLLHKCLNSQFSANKNILNGYIEHCVVALEILNKINNWMEKTLGIRNFNDNSEWLTRLNLLQKASADSQAEYSNLLQQLHSKDPERFDMTDISIKFPLIPKPPLQNLSDGLQHAIDAFLNNHCRMMQNMARMQPPPQPRPPMPQQFQMYPSHVVASTFTQQYQYQGAAAMPLTSTPQPTINNPLLSSTILNCGPRSTGMPVMMVQKPYAPSENKINYRNNAATVSEIVQSPTKSTESNAPTKIETIKEQQNENWFSSKSDKESIRLQETDQLQQENQVNNFQVEQTHKIQKNEYENKDTAGNTGDNIDNFHKRINQMREAFKAIAIKNSATGSTGSCSEDEQTETTLKYQTDDEFDRKSDCTVETVEKVTDSNSQTNFVHTKINNVDTPQLKVGTERLLQIMLEKYPGFLESEMLEIIESIRRKHNNCLSGIKLGEIFKEADEFILENQKLHVLRFAVSNEDTQPSNGTQTKKQGTKEQILQKETLSPADSHNSSTKTIEMRGTKKTWNPLPEKPRKWTASGEMECTICMNPVKKIGCYTLNCSHSFHNTCIKLWFKTERSCPNCRVVITNDDDFPPLP